MDLDFSIIIPVYNRPQEVDALLHSLTAQDYQKKFEVIVVDDGSDLKADAVVKKYNKTLDMSYFFKPNSGPGLSRNYGMERASGSYYIILDSDCILPPQYLKVVQETLEQHYTDAYGGPDANHKSFTNSQKAIGHVMTSMLTTGGIRGKKQASGGFNPRSFNMGLSKAAFLKTKGFKKYKFGEDIDLSLRLLEGGFKTQLITDAYVYHERRTSWKSFFRQTFNFGAARPILNKIHPHSAKFTFWFPSLFILGGLIALLALNFNSKLLALLYLGYFLAIFIDSLIANKNLGVALQSIYAAMIMFLGYGMGYIRSIFRLKILGRPIQSAFSEMF